MKKTLLILLTLALTTLLSNCKKKEETQHPINPDLKFIEIAEEGDRSYRMSMAMNGNGTFTILKFDREANGTYICDLVDVFTKDGEFREGKANTIFTSNKIPKGNILPSSNGGFFAAVKPKDQNDSKGLFLIKGDSANSYSYFDERASSTMPGLVKIIETSKGNYFIIGGFGGNITLSKLDNNFSNLWSKTYTSIGFSTPIDICELSDGSVGILSNESRGSIGGGDYRYMKVSADGDSIMAKDYGSNRQDGAIAMYSRDNKVYFVADERRVDLETECILTSCTENGEKLWEKNFGKNTKIRKIKSTNDELVAVGSILSNGQENFYLTGMTFLGAINWEKFYGEEAWNENAFDFYTDKDFIYLLVTKSNINLNPQPLGKILFVKDRLGK